MRRGGLRLDAIEEKFGRTGRFRRSEVETLDKYKYRRRYEDLKDEARDGTCRIETEVCTGI